VELRQVHFDLAELRRDIATAELQKGVTYFHALVDEQAQAGRLGDH
jgi:hypothetical protein